MRFKNYYLLTERAMQPETKEGEYVVVLDKKRKHRKLNPKTNRMKNFKQSQFMITKIAPLDRTFENKPDGVSFRKWLNIVGTSVGKGSDGKWYGWSHRACYGFKKGDKIKGDSLAKKITNHNYTKDEIEDYNKKNPDSKLYPTVNTINYDNDTYEDDFIIKDENHAKECAIQFAKNVS